ncbi:MAG: 4fe-4S ferredoxin iron-sulfur binding domaiN-containing protein, ferredoxin [Candidatus Peregrinibacteria bacterium GW2011_GWF2_33_10]|nr:MAG: 4fe-4S ferredoxin iron-sulfur binding domaiN-containing protein, ferredoxin [Candidatus Peregrinibacteria bacterium GW2011_GWF2_33_10]OGJ44181.1 MAG: hypothetical protein A2263_04365 [Candidatus Peregrinibacteria bacterium RIFOXYA2_FULL_33_21]OGJ46665.1 MAG: hypothetical protein A2272_04625 [Candidatus Peregrinibacteria bacterium RIFOXYA12_FULL_33_12]OGJ51810.1 MAG: hypothetical protein A2307_05030 [Candidatus Peregrinibacteria bacterium RIFOXYB2_FULL_33_20]
MKKSKIVHDRDNCIGCNACVMIAPQSWVMDEKEGKAFLIGSKKKKNLYVAEIFDCDVDVNKKAESACPMRVIKVEGEKRFS